MRILKRRNIFSIGFLCVVILNACSHDYSGRMAAYNRWKQGLQPYDPEVIEYGLRRDPDAASLVVGKSLDEVRSMFQDVHETEGSFDILVSKNLPHRPPNRKYYRWAQRYVVFEVEDRRVIALVFVHG